MRPARDTLGLVVGLAGLLAPAAFAADWPMYGRDLRNSFHNQDDTAISTANVSNLVHRWFFPTPDAVTASPAVVDGAVYVGSWDGNFYALDAATGLEKWRFRVAFQADPNPDPDQLGLNYPDRLSNDGGVITSSAAVVDGAFPCPARGSSSSRMVIFGGGRTLYALDAATGHVCWEQVICGNPDGAGMPDGYDCQTDSSDPTRIFSSPVVYDGKVYIGHTVDGQSPKHRGGFEARNVDTGALSWRFEADRDATPSGAVLTRGCGGVWSSAAIDEVNDLVFFNTADCGFGAPPPFHEAVIALHAGNGTLAWAYRPREDDTCDFDFGASPNVIDFGGTRYVGNGGKEGTYYLLKALPELEEGSTVYPESEVVWKKNVVFGGLAGGFIGSTAFDGARIYGATALGDYPEPICNPDPDDGRQEPSLHAFRIDPSATERIAWQAQENQSFGSTTVNNGVVFSGSFYGRDLRAYDAATGELLAAIPTTIASVSSSAVVVGDSVYLGSGDSFQPLGSGVHAFSLPPVELPVGGL